ncbi:hypothetical protein HanRHA438_Chr16g0770101 [Helianthus annuus]|nr:hypothetical protein HanRHA438_Chr16g0770101 [Helianthus annuus]
MEIAGHAAVDWTALEEVDEVARARDYSGHDTPWDRLFQLAYLSSYWVMVCEFLASFEFAPRPTDQPEELEDPDDLWVKVRFRLVGQWHEMSLREFVVYSGLYLMEETDNPSRRRCITPFDTFQVLASDRLGSLWPLEVEGFTYQRPLFRYLHRLIATYITPCEQSREWCNQGDLFYLYCLIWGEMCAQWFSAAHHWHDRSVLYGGRTSRVLPTHWALFPIRTHSSPRGHG